jgi:two-component sensor histidine kinase
VPISDGVEDLCANLSPIFADKKVDITVECEGSVMISQRAIQPLFLIIEELFTNAWKHAFDHQPFPKIELILTDVQHGFIRLLYKDNGKGLSQAIDLKKKDSEGLALIRHFSQSIGGRVSIDSSDGLQFEIDFDKSKILV